MKQISKTKLRTRLETLYQRYNKRQFVDPDPLVFLYNYPKVQDREIAGLIASCLAYGRVSMIMATVRGVLDALGPDLNGAVSHTCAKELDPMFKGFRYRFASQDHLTGLILRIQDILKTYGSVEACFLEHAEIKGDFDVHRGLSGIYSIINSDGRVGHLLADPGKSSACKRSHLYLRWMVRQDRVDPGGWTSVSAAGLVVPVDTHMYRIASLLGFTRRKSADKTCALEITQGFARLAPDDPVRYDFALTRFGIRREFNVDDLRAYLNGKD